MPAMSGRLITFEGGEGAGKSTQVARLRRRIRGSGCEVVTTREPGGSDRAETIRTALLAGRVKRFGPFAEALLFASARADHMRETVAPAIARGECVICDRFIDSTRVYQGDLGAVAAPLVRALERVSTDGRLPDLTVILDVPAKLGLARAQQRRTLAGDAADRFEEEGPDYHRRVREAFLRIAEAEPARCIVVDASGTPEAVEAAIWRAVDERLIRAAPARPRHVR